MSSDCFNSDISKKEREEEEVLQSGGKIQFDNDDIGCRRQESLVVHCLPVSVAATLGPRTLGWHHS